MRLQLTTALIVAVSTSSALAVTQSVVFQNGLNGYTGTFDRRIHEAVGANEFDGSTVTQIGLDGFVAAMGTTAASPDAQGLLRFGNIIGNGPGQIPANATILEAQLRVVTSTAGNAQSDGPWGVAQLMQPFDSTTSYGNFNCGGCALVSRGPWWEDGYSKRPLSAFGGRWQGDPASADVRQIVQNWANGEANNGIAIQTGFPTGTTDGWNILSTGHPIVDRRPQLSVTYTTDPVELNTFQRGLNGYAGDVSAYVKSGTNIFGITGGEQDPAHDDITYDAVTGTPTVAGNSTVTPAPTVLTTFQQFLDGPQFAATDTTGLAGSVDDFALFKFGSVFGNGAGQAPTDVPVAKAFMAVSTGTANAAALSNGEWSVHKMLRNWDATTLYSNIGGEDPGLQVIDGDISAPLDTQIGITFGSEVWFDITSYLEGVRTGAADNGVALLSTATADGWQIHLPGSDQPELRPRLVVVSGNPTIVVPGLTGDYNSNGVVDAADYVTWRNNLNQSVNLPNDSTPGTVTQADYDVWRANFGKTAEVGGPLGSGAAVPEPGTWMLSMLAAIALAGCHKSRRK